VNVIVPRGDDSWSDEPEIDTVLSPLSSARYSVSIGAVAQYALVDANGPIQIVLPLVVYPPEARLQSDRTCSVLSSASDIVNRLGSLIVASNESAQTSDCSFQTALVSMLSAPTGGVVDEGDGALGELPWHAVSAVDRIRSGAWGMPG